MGKLRIEQDRLPIGIAAGVIKTETDFRLLDKTPIIWGVVAGTYTLEERVIPDASFAWDEVGQFAQNSQRFRNPGWENAKGFLPDAIKRLQAQAIKVIISVGTSEDEDPMAVIPEMAERAVAVGADGVELNPLCPNMDHGFSFLNTDQVLELNQLTRARVGDTPVIFKVPSLGLSVIRTLAQAQPPIDGVAAINSLGGESGPRKRNISKVNTKDWVMEFDDADATEAQVISILGLAGTQEGGREAFYRVNELGAFAVGLAQHPYRLKGNKRAFNMLFRQMKKGWEQAAEQADSQTITQ